MLGFQLVELLEKDSEYDLVEGDVLLGVSLEVSKALARLSLSLSL